jgi:hypothetical protein
MVCCNQTEAIEYPGTCEAMSNRRQPLRHPFDEGAAIVDEWDPAATSRLDLYHEPAVGTIDDGVTIETEFQPGFPSMCS